MNVNEETMEKLRQDYVDESNAYITKVRSILLDLEHNKSQDKDSSLDQIYRLTHSLKSNSNTANFLEIANIAFQLEGCLSSIKKDSGKLDVESINQIFGYVENIEIFVNYFFNSLDRDEIIVDEELYVSPEMIQIYIIESQEHIDSANKLLFALEEGKLGRYDVIEEIYREIHSIKGDSNALGFEKAAEKAHEMETFMSELQTHPEQFNNQTIEHLFVYVEIIKKLIDKHLEEKVDEDNKYITENNSNEEESEDMEISDEIKELYAVEVVEHINNINNILFDLEAEKSELKASLEGIFREIHSIKGDSNALGISKVGQAAHNMETFMSELQKNPEQ
ncbi:MAG: Hpt domain-containing protein, partial [Candidatus Sericytochromatia bacterium]|nr:Hpt domain-containing protein [Candidatus Sericytochromatia bacterium]